MSEHQYKHIGPTSLGAPTVDLPNNLQPDEYGNYIFGIDTRRGRIDVWIHEGRKTFNCHGEQEAIIAGGLARPEWLPGMPGNGHTANSVVFYADGPRVVIGRRKGCNHLPHIHIRAWGFVKRTVEVAIPMTGAQILQYEFSKKGIERDEAGYAAFKSAMLTPVQL